MTRWTRADAALLALYQDGYPMSLGAICRCLGLRRTPYMREIMANVTRRGLALAVPVRAGRRTDTLYSLTPAGEARARMLLYGEDAN